MKKSRLSQKSCFNQFSYATLEPRRVLAGGVQVLVDNAILLVVGDGADNQVEITQNEAGGFVVTGVNTTINGGESSFVVEGGVKHVTVSLGDGDDVATVDGISVQSNFSFYGGQGNDRLVAQGLSARHFHAEGNQGDDVFELDFIIRKSAYVYLGEGADIVSTGSMFVGRNLKIFGAGGDDTISTEILTVGRKLVFELGTGGDDVLMTGTVNVRKHSRIDLGDGDDFIGILPERNSGLANFGKSLTVEAGGGDDQIAFDAGLLLRGSYRADGGPGTDSIEIGATEVNGVIPGSVVEIENRELTDLDALVDQVFARLQDADIGVEAPVEPLAVSGTATELSFIENAAAVSVDVAFEITGSVKVTGAVVEIEDFQEGEDVLTFTDTADITGSFDSTTGEMTLSGNASTGDYQAAVRGVRYNNTSEAPSTGSRRFTITVTAGDATESVSRDLVVLAENDRPVITPGSATQTVSPGELPVAVDAAVTVSDPDSSNLQSATVKIISGFVAGEDTLAVQDANGITSVYNANIGTLTLTGDAGVADWETILRSVMYTNESGNPTEGVRTIRTIINDGDAAASAETELDLQQVVQRNSFTISESSAAGIALGQVQPSGSFETPTIFQFASDQTPQEFVLRADDHFSGSMTASVVLIEYLDFQCPNCASFHPVVEQLESDFVDDLLVVRRHLPLESIHVNARAAARVVEAASRQGKYDEMADEMFSNQAEWEFVADPTALFEGYATSIGLDITQLRTDIADPAIDARITRDADGARAIGIQSTASFVLQGSRIDSPPNAATFGQVIEDAEANADVAFLIDLETGEILIRDPNLLDATTNPTVTLSVLVTDASGNTETVAVTINVTS